MPRENAATPAAQGVNKGAQEGQSGESNAVSTSVPETTAAELLAAANVPVEVVKALEEQTGTTEDRGTNRASKGANAR
jgi:hypothetical protein